MLIKKKYSGYWINKLEPSEHWLFCWHQIKSFESYIKLKFTLSEIRVDYGFTSSDQISNNINVFALDIVEKNQLTSYHMKQSSFLIKAMFTFTFLKFFNI